ncbi:MAG: HAD hydrolase family protein, partial [Chloroflexota bacterium]
MAIMRNKAANTPIFNEPPKAIVVDLDGTLLDSKGHLSARNAIAIERCIASRLPVIVATSRAERSIRKLIGHELTDLCSLVMMNGAIAKGVAPLSGFLR